MARQPRKRLLGQGGASRRRGRFGAGLFFLAFVSAALLLLSRLDHSAIREARWRAAELFAPVLKAIHVPMQPLKSGLRRIASALEDGRELERLRDENQRLQVWEWRARELERKLADLGRLAKGVEEQPLPFVTARVLANSSGPFVRSAMIGAGREHDLKSGYPAITGDGLVGRVVETGAQAARVLFVTDLNSRIPVHVGRRAIRAVMAGDNGPEPRLTLMPAEAEIAAGDDVATSGIGGLFPRGLRIGTVVGGPGNWRVKPAAMLEDIEYMSILMFESPTLRLTDGAPPVAASKGAVAAEPERSVQVEPKASIKR